MSSYGKRGYRVPTCPGDGSLGLYLPQNPPARKAAFTRDPRTDKFAAACVAYARMEQEEQEEQKRRNLLGLRF